MARIKAENSSTYEENIQISNVMELLAEEDDNLTLVDEAANFDKSTYDVLSADLLDSTTILPNHLR